MPDKVTYVRLHKQFLQKHQPNLYRQMLAEGTLAEHLNSVGQAASEMDETLTTQMVTRKDLPTDYLERVKELEQVPHVVEEIVLAEVVHQPLPTN